MKNTCLISRSLTVCFCLASIVLLSACGQTSQERALETARELARNGSISDTEAIESLSASNQLLERLASVKIRASQEQVYVLRRLLERYKDQQMWPRASETVDQLIELQPTESRWHLEKGQIHSSWSQVDPDQVPVARRAYETVLELKPDSLSARYGLGILHGFRADNPNIARQYLREVANRQPITAKNRPMIRRGRFALGRLEFEQGNLSAAARQFQAVTEMESIAAEYHFLAHRNLGRTYRQMNDLDRARNHYQRAYEIQPTDGTVRRQLRELGVDVSDRYNRFE